ncbi:SDR family oxidoreductase [Streptomyces tubbatahanensis]|uniref:SDR family oxidoreductase n=1 Tax=Streptomyces tubbatahanensis TaxID=2923272 RepID=A0ABY3Y267_9ACTN|nr:SDR family oxidoreductase [Streptomyces tubbatahanensis]UNT00791.1 SDR family oxidoreductase [Streptomyces tubbatahanensis]
MSGVTSAERSVLVIGANGGIGRAVVDRLTADGWSVTGTDLPEVDLSRGGVVAEHVARLWSRQGGFDALVHAAGVFPAAPVVESDEELFDRVMAVNTRSALSAGTEFVRRCRAEGRPGTLLFVSSGAAARARLGTAVYAASKAALDALVRGIALEHGRDGIRCCAVAPGFVDVRSAVNPVPRAYVDALTQASVRGRVGRPGDIAAVLCWLLGPDAGWVNGRTVPVDGGDGVGTLTAPNWLS